jgi:hypothetical protein
MVASLFILCIVNNSLVKRVHKMKTKLRDDPLVSTSLAHGIIVCVISPFSFNCAIALIQLTRGTVIYLLTRYIIVVYFNPRMYQGR